MKGHAFSKGSAMALVWLAAACLASPALADAPGPRGPIGPQGHIGPPGGKPVAPAPAAAASRQARGNHIEASGNQASGVVCGPGGANVNSVDVQGARLDGRTVIVQGRNTHGVDTRDCPAPVDGHAPAQVNSIRVR
ncbi:hypothetical protein [Pulveribacter suum]|uniref:DUF3060 domain-containing protein n=1 Tax=Pulveribacter suum TaxID=2116657 RepID=A0A2P1NJK3_9BURK|nr:hypothetical protein [Pulveribacter suum]AVP57196.1 hypothetical protein C7H73_05630 [Pulveribacter suum]